MKSAMIRFCRMTMLVTGLVAAFATTASAAVDLGEVQVPSVGHRFIVFPGGATIPSGVSDLLIDQGQSTGGGAVVSPVTANFDTNNQFAIKISAPPGKKFLVRPPAGQGVQFGAGLNWQGPYILSNGPSMFGTVEVSFSGLEGAAPDFSASRTVLSQLHGFFGFNDIQSSHFSNQLAFTSITMTATVPQAYAGSGPWTYNPSSGSFGLIYRTPETNDPGGFVSIVPAEPVTNSIVPLAEALDATSAPFGPWTTGGAASWIGQTAVSFDGIDAAQSGPVPDGASSSFQTVVNGPGTLRFRWKVSSETNNDKLAIYISGSKQSDISGEVDWRQATFSIPAGMQTLEWRYSKNASATAGQDRAWVDQVSFVASNVCTFAISPVSRVHGDSVSTGTVVVATTTVCNWSVANTSSWVTVLSPPTNTGPGTVTYVVAANSFPNDRSTVLSIAGTTFTVTQLGNPTPPTYGGTDIGPVEVADIGHSFFNPFPPPYPSGITERWSVVDYLIDQDHSSGGGATLPNVSINWDTNDHFSLTIKAPADKKFQIQVPSGQTVRFGGYLWWESTRGGFSPSGPVEVALENLEGSAPGFGESDATLSDSHGYFGFVDVTSSPFSNNLSFTAMTLRGHVQPQYTGNGTENYVPHHESSLQVGYTTGQTNDPGRFVFLVPRETVPGCSVTISPNSRMHGYGAASNFVTVTTSSGCPWTIFNTNSWIAILSSPTNSGNGIVNYSIAANNSASPRTGVVTIGNQSFTVTQFGGSCAYTISPTSRNHGPDSGSGTVNLTTLSDCAWAVSNTNDWISVTSPFSGSGSSTVSYLVASNASNLSRSGSISVAGQIFTVTQSGKSLTNSVVSPAQALDTEGSLTWSTVGSPAWSGQTVISHDGIDAAEAVLVPDNTAVTIQTTVTGPGTIQFWWKVSSEADKDYLKFFVDGVQQTRISGEADWQSQSFVLASGSHVLKWTYAKNASGIAGLDKAWVDQVTFVPGSVCTYAVVPTNRVHGYAAATNSVSVVSSAGCNWAIATSSSWITILSPVTNTGSGTFSYALAANPSTNDRSAVISVAGVNVAIVQLGSPTPPAYGGTDIGPVEVTSIGHYFSNPFPPPYPSGITQRWSVVDYLIDHDHSSGGGAALPNVAINWDTNDHFTVTIKAPADKKFKIQAPPGQSVRFGGYLWWESTRGGFSPSGPVEVSFENLEGTAPDFSESDATLSDSHGYFGFVDVPSSTFSNDLAFTAMTLRGRVQPQYTGHGTENYIPHHESSLQVGYTTSQTNDPGQFVFLVPRAAVPTISIASLSSSLGATLMVQGTVGRTHIVECSTDLVTWTPISTNVISAAVCPDCSGAGTYVADPAGTNAPRRFYRVLQLP